MKIKKGWPVLTVSAHANPEMLGGAELVRARDHLQPKFPQSGSVGFARASESMQLQSEVKTAAVLCSVASSVDCVMRALSGHEPRFVGAL